MDPSILRTPTGSCRLTVFYHGGCPDGIAGAWAIYQALPPAIRAALAGLGGLFTDGRGAFVDPLIQLNRVGVVFSGVSPGDDAIPPALTKGRDVVFVDVVPSLAEARGVAARARSLAILDHHRSAVKATEAARRVAAKRGIPFTAVYSEAQAGAQIAWDWAHGGVSARPAVIDYVADRDLWTWALADSRAVNKALYTEGHTLGFAALAALSGPGLWAEALGGLALRGAAYLAYEEILLARLAANAYPATVASLPPGETEPREWCVLAVNAPCLQSELGEAVFARAGPEVHFVVIWAYARARDEIYVSARTTRPDVDLSAIAPHVCGAHSGGGHARAAGFTIAGDSVGAAVRRRPA